MTGFLSGKYANKTGAEWQTLAKQDVSTEKQKTDHGRNNHYHHHHQHHRFTCGEKKAAKTTGLN